MNEYFTKHTEWYWKRFFHHAANCSTYKEAYELTEAEHYERFEFNKYDDYITFRQNKSAYIKKKQGRTAKTQDKQQMKLW